MKYYALGFELPDTFFDTWSHVRTTLRRAGIDPGNPGPPCAQVLAPRPYDDSEFEMMQEHVRILAREGQLRPFFAAPMAIASAALGTGMDPARLYLPLTGKGVQEQFRHVHEQVRAKLHPLWSEGSMLLMHLPLADVPLRAAGRALSLVAECSSPKHFAPLNQLMWHRWDPARESWVEEEEVFLDPEFKPEPVPT